MDIDVFEWLNPNACDECSHIRPLYLVTYNDKTQRTWLCKSCLDNFLKKAEALSDENNMH